MIRKLEPLLRESKQASLSVKDLIQSGPGAGVLSSIQRCTHGLESPPFVRWNNRENVWGRRGMGSCSSKYRLSMEDLLTEDIAYKSILPILNPFKQAESRCFSLKAKLCKEKRQIAMNFWTEP